MLISFQKSQFSILVTYPQRAQKYTDDKLLAFLEAETATEKAYKEKKRAIKKQEDADFGGHLT